MNVFFASKTNNRKSNANYYQLAKVCLPVLSILKGFELLEILEKLQLR